MYEIKNIILPNDCIGNSLSTMNLNFDTLENWTNSILLSSKVLFQPLVDFYNSYGDFWKSSINFSIAINAIDRLTEFNTQVTTNSAKFIKPIVIIYPDIFEYNAIYLDNYKNTVSSWFKTNYPVVDSNNSETLFVENTVAFVYMMFYSEVVKVNNTLAGNNRLDGNNTPPLGKSITCSTRDVSTVVNCKQTYRGNVDCGIANSKKGYSAENICDKVSPKTCTNTKTVGCFMEGGGKSSVRTGNINVDQYFKDRSEYEQMDILKMVVKNCEWVLDGVVPYYE